MVVTLNDRHCIQAFLITSTIHCALYEQVLLRCGGHNALLSVSEPRQCRYRATFASPLLCGDDTVMAVYPRLTT